MFWGWGCWSVLTSEPKPTGSKFGRLDKEGACFKLRMDYKIQDTVILLTNKLYIMYNSHERARREETLSHPGRKTHACLHVCTHMHIPQNMIIKRLQERYLV